MYLLTINGTSLFIEVLLLLVVLPSAVTLFVPVRWLPVWLGLLTLMGVGIWSQPIDGPGGLGAYLGLLMVTMLNGLIILARTVKIAIDRDREQ